MAFTISEKTTMPISALVTGATVKIAPLKKAPVTVAPLKIVPLKKAPVTVAPVTVAPLKIAPLKKAPLKKTPVNIAMNWIGWSEKSKDIPFKSTQTGVGDGEQKMSAELDTPINGQNSSFDMSPILNGVKVNCDIKKLDSKDDFNTGKTGRDNIRHLKNLHTTLLESFSIFEKSDIFTCDERKTFAGIKDKSPDELAVGTLEKIEEGCKILNKKKTTLYSSLPHVPFTLFSQTKEISLDIAYDICQKSGIDFPSEFKHHIKTILILQKMEHIYIDKPAKFMEDLHNIVEKLFNDMRIIIVDDKKGYIILPDISRIKFYRITRGCPRFQVLF